MTANGANMPRCLQRGALFNSEEKTIFALMSYYSGVLIDSRLVRGTSDRLPEPEKLLFKTLNEAKA